MASENFNSNNNHESEQTNLEKHKNKLTRFYLSLGDQRYIYRSSDPEFSSDEVTQSDRDAIVENIKNGVDYSDIEKKLLTNIAGPEYSRVGDEIVYRPDRVFDEMSDDKHQKRILTYMTGQEWEKYNETDARNIDMFLREYPTPMDFERDAEDFIQLIEDANGEEKGQEYREAMEQFKHTVYGKKYEYFLAMQDFHREASEQKKQETQSINNSNILDMSYGAGGMNASSFYETESKPKDYTEIDRNEAMNILRYTRLEGDPISFHEGQPKQLISANKLLNNELEPRFQFSLEDVNFNTSRAFKIGSRDAVICYVNTPDGRVTARSYYRSNSQGVWRYLPDYKLNEDGNVGWYGKGAGEQQLTLPMEIQGTLNEIAKQSYSEQQIEMHSATEMKECFFGTAKEIQRIGTYTTDRMSGNLGDALDREVNNHPTITIPGSLRNLPPEAMYTDVLIAPNFDHMTGEFDMQSEIYGDAKIRTFDSNDGRLSWSIIEDSQGRACVGSIQMKSKISSTGLRQNWVNGGDFTMPLYEYNKQSYNLGDSEDQKGNYTCMWKNCLSRMPIIKAYKGRGNNGQPTYAPAQRLNATA